MAVDVNIGTVETEVSATDPELLKNPAFIARLVAMVKEELKREALEEERRMADRSASRNTGRRR